MLNTDGMILSYIHINMPGGTQSRGMAPLALVLNLLARRKTMYLRQGERLGIYLQNLLIVSFSVTLHVKLGVDLIPLVGRNEETKKRVFSRSQQLTEISWAQLFEGRLALTQG